MFGNGQFGAAFVSFTLEHTCDPHAALAELHRVADEVFVVYPKPWRLSGRLLPGRRWTVHEDRPGRLRFEPITGKRCNSASRYGGLGAIPMIGRP